MHKREFKNTSGVHVSSHKPTKVCNEIKQTKKKQHMHIDGRRAFIESMWKTHAIDINELQVDLFSK